MKKLLMPMLTIAFIGTLSCTYSSDSNDRTSEAGTASNQRGTQSLASEAQTKYLKDIAGEVQIQTDTVNITSENRTYKAYIASPTEDGKYPAIVLIHSFRGFEPGYQQMVDRTASNGYVVIAPFWQTYSQSPSDAEVETLIRSAVEYLEKREDVDSEKLGLTGFCAGGRYTMLFLPQIKDFNSGIAWYGFPYTGGTESQPEKPASLISQLDTPMLVIHGTRDQLSNITDIYKYAGELDEANRYFELKVYQGEPHGFMITEKGELSESFVAQDAYKEMMDFFDRTLNRSSQ